MTTGMGITGFRRMGLPLEVKSGFQILRPPK